MMLRICLGLLLTGLALGTRAARAELPSFFRGRCGAVPSLCDAWRCRQQCWCPDDYGPKRLPAAPCGPRCWCPNDYCPKPLPPAPCRTPGAGADDYCPKDCPILLGVGCGPWYTCGSVTCCFRKLVGSRTDP